MITPAAQLWEKIAIEFWKENPTKTLADDVGTYGSASDSHIFLNSNRDKRFYKNMFKA